MNRTNESIRSAGITAVRSLLFLSAGIVPEVPRDDWESIVSSLTREDTRYWNRLIIPIYATLKQTTRLELISADARSALQHKFMTLLAVQVRQQAWVAKVVRILVDQKIPAILLKGAGTAGSLYDPAYSRLSQDIDLLIRRIDIRRFTEAIREIALPRVTGPSRLFSEKHRYQTNLPIKTELPFNIEPHFDLHPRFLFRTDLSDVWDCSLQHPMFDSPEIRILSPEYAIVYIATHSFLHLEFEPHHLVDAFRLLTKCKPDMDLALRYAERWGCLKIFYVLMKQMESWFGIANPESCPNPVVRRVKKHENLYSDPRNPSKSDVSLKNQIRSMHLHDSFFRVMLFSASFAFKRLMDKTLMLLNKRPIMKERDHREGSPDNER